jgi:hypothetical protein
MKKNYIPVRGIPPASPRYTAPPARYAAPAEQEQADPAAGRLTATPVRYTAPGPQYTAGGGANDDLGRRSSASDMRTGRMRASEVTGDWLQVLLGSSKSFGLHGP